VNTTIRIAQAKRRLAEARTPTERQKAQNTLDALLVSAPHWADGDRVTMPPAEAAGIRAGPPVKMLKEPEIAPDLALRSLAVRPPGQARRRERATAQYPVPMTLLRVLRQAYAERPRSWDVPHVVEAVLAGWHYLRRSEQDLSPLE